MERTPISQVFAPSYSQCYHDTGTGDSSYYSYKIIKGRDVWKDALMAGGLTAKDTFSRIRSETHLSYIWEVSGKCETPADEAIVFNSVCVCARARLIE